MPDEAVVKLSSLFGTTGGIQILRGYANHEALDIYTKLPLGSTLLALFAAPYLIVRTLWRCASQSSSSIRTREAVNTRCIRRRRAKERIGPRIESIIPVVAIQLHRRARDPSIVASQSVAGKVIECGASNYRQVHRHESSIF